MTEILWGPYQEHHITMRGVAAEEFEAAWIDRIDLVVRGDDSYESVGATNGGREVYESFPSPPGFCPKNASHADPLHHRRYGARKQAEQQTLEERVTRLEERLARLGG